LIVYSFSSILLTSRQFKRRADL